MHEHRSLNTWLEVNKLSLNIAKTAFMVIGSRQRLATHGNLDLVVFVDNKRIKRVSSSESLGLTIDENLNWSKHIDNISKKVSSGIGALKRMRSFIDKETAIKVYQGLIEPYLTCVANYARRYKNYRIELPVPSPVLLTIFERLLF